MRAFWLKCQGRPKVWKWENSSVALDKTEIKKKKVSPLYVFNLKISQYLNQKIKLYSHSSHSDWWWWWWWYCVMCWRAEGDDLIIVVFMDHWAAGLDFCYWIMGNSFFLLKEWLPNPIRQSAVLGQRAFTIQKQQQCHSLPICRSETWNRYKGGGFCFLKIDK